MYRGVGGMASDSVPGIPSEQPYSPSPGIIIIIIIIIIIVIV